MVTALLDEEEKQEENEGMTLSSKSLDLVEQTLCGAFIGVPLLVLDGFLLTMLTGSSGEGTEMTSVSR
eukprot:14884041-Ditylum_brightwellii.AAC.2